MNSKVQISATSLWAVSLNALSIDMLLEIDVGQMQIKTNLPDFVIRQLKDDFSKSIIDLERNLRKYRENMDPVLLRTAFDTFVSRIVKSHEREVGQVVVKVKPGKTTASQQVYLKFEPVPHKFDTISPKFRFSGPTLPMNSTTCVSFSVWIRRCL